MTTVKPPATTADLSNSSGEDRIAWNVSSSWAAHLVLMASGFIMPRYMDRHLGQEALGVWDFGWSLVSYLSLTEAGIGSSVNRYVAKYRADGDSGSLNDAVSSVMVVQLWAAFLILLLSAVASVVAGWLLTDPSGFPISETRWVFCLLGASLAVRIAFSAYDGVITGCHRWDLHNSINAGFHGLTVLGMIALLRLGASLRGLALMYLGGVILAEATRAFVAHRVCRELDLRRRRATWARAIEMLVFGGKSFLASVAERLVYQTTSILIVSTLGPAALALYSRPLALVQAVKTLSNKLAFVLTPTAASLSTSGRVADLRILLAMASRSSVYVSLPLILLLCVLGGPVLQVWMGPRYAVDLLLGILALGHLAIITQQPLISVLTGLDRHGKPAAIMLGASAVSATLCGLVLGPLHGDLVHAALAVVLPLTLAAGCIPIYGCRQLGVPVSRYFRNAWARPLACAAPFGLVLLVTRLTLGHRPSVSLACGALVGGLVIGATYWGWALPRAVRRRMRLRLAELLWHPR